MLECISEEISIFPFIPYLSTNHKRNPSTVQLKLLFGSTSLEKIMITITIWMDRLYRCAFVRYSQSKSPLLHSLNFSRVIFIQTFFVAVFPSNLPLCIRRTFCCTSVKTSRLKAIKLLAWDPLNFSYYLYPPRILSPFNFHAQDLSSTFISNYIAFIEM